MELSRIRKLPGYSWKLAVKAPRFDYGKSDRAVFGFDTEYDSKTGELLTVQLYRPGFEVYHVCPPGYRLDYDNLRKLCGSFRKPFLVAFFSLADISKIANWWDAYLSDTGLGMYMAQYNGMTIYDVGTFWSSDRGFSLKRLGDLVGMPKLDWNTRQVNRSTLSEPGFREYAMRDAEICFEAYNNFIRASVWKLFDIDVLRFRSSPTISSYLLRRTFKRPVEAPTRLVRHMALACYWGGRSEVFKTGRIRGSIVEADANSEYPRSAIEIEAFPDATDWQIGGNWRNYLGGFVEIIFKYPDGYKGRYALPVSYEKLLYWPALGHSYCTTYELEAALRHCPALQYKIRAVAGFKKANRRELPEYLAELLAKKDSCSGADRYVYKLLANSVIGKLAQNRRVVNDGRHIRSAAALGIPPDYSPRYGRPRIEVGNCYWPEAASLILGKARAVLYEAMEKCKDTLILCSTDSVVYEGEPKPFRIGSIPFEIENQGDEIIVWREKVYCITRRGTILKAARHALPYSALVKNGRVCLSPDAVKVAVESKEFVKLSKAARGERFGSVLSRSRVVSLTPQKWFEEKTN